MESTTSGEVVYDQEVHPRSSCRFRLGPHKEIAKAYSVLEILLEYRVCCEGSFSCPSSCLPNSR